VSEAASSGSTAPPVLRRRTVLVVGPFRETAGGIVTFHRNLVERSDLRRRWRFVRFCTSRPPKDETLGNDAYRALFRSGPRRIAGAAARTAHNLLRFPLVVLRERPSVVQIQAGDRYAFWEAALYALMARGLGRRTVVRCGGSFDAFHGSSRPAARRLIRACLHVPHALVVPSEGWRSVFAAVSGRAGIHVVPNAVALAPPPPARPPRTRGVRALFICTAEARRKGIDLVLDAVPRLHGEVEFLLVAANAAARRLVHDRGLDDRVRLLADLPRTELPTLYREADLLLLPSRSEGCPNSLLEAMAAGLPAVATTVGAIPEMVTDGVHALLVRPDDAEGFVEAVRRLARDPELRSRLGRRAYERAREAYELDRVFSRLESVWEDGVAGAGTPCATGPARARRTISGTR
jgi:glycosyltransferase involved in cell wall biosynthesis